MSKLIYIDSGDPLSSARPNVKVPVGIFAGFMLEVKGTTLNAQTFSVADVGEIRFNRNGDEQMLQTFEFFHLWNNLIGGYPVAVTPAGTGSEETRVYAWIPVNYPGAPNAINVRSTNEAYFDLRFDATAIGTDLSDVSWTLFGVKAATGLPEWYQLKLSQQVLSFGGAGSANETLDPENIAAFYFSDSGDLLERISVTVDGEHVVQDISDDAINAETNFMRRIEQTAVDLTEIELASGGNMIDAINSEVRVRGNASGALDLTLSMFHVSFLQNAQSAISDAQSRATRQINRIPQGARAALRGGRVPGLG